jgi:hypothetical protein
MSGAQALNQKTVSILLAAIAGLLVVVIGVVIYQQNTAVPDVDPSQPASTGQTDGAAQPAVGTPAPPADFDPTTAPKVAEGQTPEQFVTAYYQACQEGDYEAAFAMLPTATAATYGDSTAFAEQVAGYGISGYSVKPQVENGDTCTVQGAQQVGDMGFVYTWTFVKGEDGSWLAQSREMGGME